MLKNVAIRAILAHLKIVENHAFSQEGEGAQNCLCKKVGPFVEACWQGYKIEGGNFDFWTNLG